MNNLIALLGRLLGGSEVHELEQKAQQTARNARDALIEANLEFTQAQEQARVGMEHITETEDALQQVTRRQTPLIRAARARVTAAQARVAARTATFGAAAPQTRRAQRVLRRRQEQLRQAERPVRAAARKRREAVHASRQRLAAVPRAHLRLQRASEERRRAEEHERGFTEPLSQPNLRRGLQEMVQQAPAIAQQFNKGETGGGLAGLATAGVSGLAMAAGGPYGVAIAGATRMLGQLAQMGGRAIESMLGFATASSEARLALGQMSPSMAVVGAQKEQMDFLRDMRKGEILSRSESVLQDVRNKTRNLEQHREIREQMRGQGYQLVEQQAQRSLDRQLSADREGKNGRLWAALSNSWMGERGSWYYNLALWTKRQRVRLNPTAEEKKEQEELRRAHTEALKLSKREKEEEYMFGKHLDLTFQGQHSAEGGYTMAEDLIRSGQGQKDWASTFERPARFPL